MSMSWRRIGKNAYDVFRRKSFENRSHTLSTYHQKFEQRLGVSDRPQEADQVSSKLVCHQRRRVAALPPRKSNIMNNLKVGNPRDQLVGHLLCLYHSGEGSNDPGKSSDGRSHHRPARADRQGTD